MPEVRKRLLIACSCLVLGSLEVLAHFLGFAAAH
jgi:hypothetical protein